LNHTLPFGDESFDLVACIHAIQCVSDRPRLWREFLRILVSSGTLAVEAKEPGTEVTPPAASGAVAWLNLVVKRCASRTVVQVPAERMGSELRVCGFTNVRATVAKGRIRVSARGRTRG
jgi:ubiquinone/menaquinone biosynthesis C-methylase UbiE